MTWLTNPYRFGLPLVPAGAAIDWELFFLGNLRDEMTVMELEMAAAPAGADQCNGGTATATHNTNAASNAFNGIYTGANYTTFDRCYGARLGYTFPSAVAVREIRMTVRSDSFHYQGPTAFILRRSIDGGATWQGVGIFTVGGAWWTSGETKTWTISEYLLPDHRSKARIWMLNVSSRQSGTNGILRCGELEMARSAAGANIAPGGSPLAIRGDAAQNNGNLFDGTTSNYWHTDNSFQVPPWYLGYVFDTDEPNIAEIRAASNPSGDPFTDSIGAYAVQWSSNGIDFHTTDSAAGLGYTATSQFKTITVSP